MPQKPCPRSWRDPLWKWQCTTNWQVKRRVDVVERPQLLDLDFGAMGLQREDHFKLTPESSGPSLPVVELFPAELGMAASGFTKPVLGSPLATVLRRVEEDSETFRLPLLGGSARCLWMPSEGVLFAGYHLEVTSVSPFVLSAKPGSVFPLHLPGDRIGKAVVDLFSGSGAMGVALEALGFKVMVSVDSCYLCCDHLAQNGRGYVIQGDVCCPTTISRVHEILHNANIKDFVMIGGFPRQPFSSQGRMMEEENPRFNAFLGLMNATRQLQPRALLVACVPNAGRNALIQSRLASLCKDMHWGLRQLTFALKDQWPMSRNRWYCIMSEECMTILYKILNFSTYVQHCSPSGECSGRMTTSFTSGRLHSGAMMGDCYPGRSANCCSSSASLAGPLALRP